MSTFTLEKWELQIVFNICSHNFLLGCEASENIICSNIEISVLEIITNNRLQSFVLHRSKIMQSA